MQERTKTTTRLPEDVRNWLAQRAARNLSSVNSEIVRVVREKMDCEAMKEGA